YELAERPYAAELRATAQIPHIQLPVADGQDRATAGRRGHPLDRPFVGERSQPLAAIDGQRLEDVTVREQHDRRSVAQECNGAIRGRPNGSELPRRAGLEIPPMSLAGNVQGQQRPPVAREAEHRRRGVMATEIGTSEVRGLPHSERYILAAGRKA